MKRREFVRRMLPCAAVAGAVTGIARGEDIPRLRDVAQRKNLLAGSAVSYRELQQAAFTTVLADQASIVVPENEMKWHIIHPEPERYDFSGADALISFAGQH